ncbi:MAG: hypothetical protein DDT26_00114 [Dehalococcoidia bacterium]|nr:hypothetical protein [Chloroflexota bacterium]
MIVVPNPQVSDSPKPRLWALSSDKITLAQGEAALTYNFEKLPPGRNVVIDNLIVYRESDRTLKIYVLLPIGVEASEAERFPKPITVSSAGRVLLPGQEPADASAPPEAPEVPWTLPELVISPDPVGFRNAMLTRPALLPIYVGINNAADENPRLSHRFMIFLSSLQNQPWLVDATQAALNAVVAIYPLGATQQEQMAAAFAEFGLDLSL